MSDPDMIGDPSIFEACTCKLALNPLKLRILQIGVQVTMYISTGNQNYLGR